MQEIVPPKLNKDTGVFSLVINRKNLVIGIIVGVSLLLWSSHGLTFDNKVILQLILILLLSPFMFDTYGRPLHLFLVDLIKFFVSKKEQELTLYKEIDNGIIKVKENHYAQVYRIEPINLSMSGEEEINVFKKFMQQTLFVLDNQIQIITVQKASNLERSFASEEKKVSKLDGKVKECAEQYLEEYKALNQTFERTFYLVFHVLTTNKNDVSRRLEDQFNSFGRLLEQTKVKLVSLAKHEVQDVYNHILNTDKTKVIVNDEGKQLSLEGVSHRTYMISEFPQIIYPNWLYDLMNYNEPLIISQFVKPVDSLKALSGLRNRITNLSADFYNRQEKGKVHTIDLEQAIQDARTIESSIVRGTEKLYAMSMYIQLSNSDIKKLEENEKALKNFAYAKQLKLFPLIYKHREGLENFLFIGIDRLKEEIYLTSSNVSSSLPFTSTTLNDPEGIFYGISLEGSKVNFNRFSPSSKNFNGIIFAISGAGKSFAAKLEAYRSLFRGIKVFIIDPEGEFKALCRHVGGANIEINPESKIKVNPLQFFSKSKDKVVMRTHLGVVKGLLKIWLSKETYNKGLVSKAVNEVYKRKGITLENPETYMKEHPTVSDLIEVFESLGDVGKRIASELLEYSRKGELGDLYDNPTSTEINFNAPMVVFDIQKVPEQEKQSAIYYLSNFIWQKVLSDRKKKILIIDEAHLLLKEESSANFIENLVRRGRKYNLGVISISQDVDDFLLSKQGSVIAKNAETALILSQKKQSIPSLVKAFDLSEIEQDYITRLSKGQGLFIKGDMHTPLYIYPTECEVELFSSNANSY